MLSHLSDDVANCYRRAAESQELASLAATQKDRDFARAFACAAGGAGVLYPEQALHSSSLRRSRPLMERGK